MRLIYWFILLISFSAIALDSVDKMKVRILKALPENILILSRGLEDGVGPGEHIKITNETGFIARGICLKSKLSNSHWKLYRVVRPEQMSLDKVYTLTSMLQSEVPDDLKNLKYDPPGEYEDLPEMQQSKQLQLQQDRIVNFDLPKRLDLDPPKKIEKKYDQQTEGGVTFSEDTKNFELDLYASPFQFRQRTQTRNYNYGVRVKNKAKKYRLQIGALHREEQAVDDYQKTKVSNMDQRLIAGLEIVDLWRGVNSFSYFQYRSSKEGKLHNHKNHYEIAPFGLKFYLFRGDRLRYITAGYLPMLYNRKLEYYGSENDIATESITGIRHAFRFSAKWQILEELTVQSTVWYRPRMKMSSYQLDNEDHASLAVTQVSWNPLERVILEYRHEYHYDIWEKRMYGVNPVDQIHTINIHYTIPL